jgi:hypothetical protein
MGPGKDFAGVCERRHAAAIATFTPIGRTTGYTVYEYSTDPASQFLHFGTGFL